MLKMKLTSLMILVVLLGCPLSVFAKINSVCCSGKNMTKQQCCETHDGFWCEEDQSCIGLGQQALLNSPCMNEQACTSIYASWCGDENIHKCFDNYYEYMTSGCSTITKTRCNNYYGQMFRWCDIPGKEGCYYYNIVAEPRYSTHCVED